MQTLTPSQLRLVDEAAASMDISFLGNDEFEEYPGYAVFQGEPLRDDEDLFVLNGLSSAPGARDSDAAGFGEAVISRMVMRDAGFDVRGFDPEEHVPELRRASDLLDADSTCWDAFIDNGGKALMYHGTYDQLISVNSTVQYYEALCDRYDREETQGFCRLYLVPGFGHSIGLVDMGADLLGTLDAWVCEGERPESIVAHERRYDREDREYLLCPFPWYPRYVGGNPAKASSYKETLDH
ncbi:MAG: tannase/feruloyl esterase family alpha/beta hydrolase [Olsenella sp.]|nr:tannase/feruloyl esterase family alpha/beta hydrolase [Olsenella sp.]